MPSKYSLFKSNKSQASLLSSQEARSQHTSPTDTPLQSPGFPPAAGGYPTAHGDEYKGHFGQQQDIHRPEPDRYYQSGLPTRSQSQRSPPSYYAGQPTIHLVRPPHSSAEPATFAEDDPRSFYTTSSTNSTETKRSKRSFFGIGHSTSGKESQSNPPTTLQQSSKPLGRSISVRRKTPAHLSPADQQHNQHHWPATQGAVPRPGPSSEEEDGGARLDRFLQETATPIPSIPAKDPLRSPVFSTSPQHPPHQMRGPLQRVNTDSSIRQSSQRRDEYESPQREGGPAQPPQYQRDSTHPPTQQPQFQAFQPTPQPTSNTYHPFQAQRPTDNTSQHPFQQHQDNQRVRPPSQQSYEPPSPSTAPYRAYDPLSEAQQSRTASQQIPSSQYIQGSMAPPPGPPPQTRRSTDLNQTNAQSGPPQGGANVQGYGQGGQAHNQPSSAATAQYPGPPPAPGQQGGNYRSPPPSQAAVAQQALGEQGRSTPPPGKSRDEAISMDMAQLIARHDELQAKYNKVKKYYFDKDAQVQQLQNTLAHQRLSQSRTSLDDNEYATRFNRLDGAINNLSFNIRKEWRAIPPWLQPFVNKDAHTTGTKEMTAVGRASITRWIVDEILDRYFHPGLEPSLSSQLKIIEKNIRRYAPPTNTDEEKDALLAKISNWRLTSLDGLHEMLASPQAADYRTQLTQVLVEKLTASLQMNLKDPPPPDLEGGVSMIVELAVGIAANLPLESRDVYVEYFLPGAPVNAEYMKIESSLPVLTNPGSGTEGMDTDKVSLASTEGDTKDDQQASSGAANSKDADPSGLKDQQQQKKKSMFGGLINKKPTGTGETSSTARSSVSTQGGQPPGSSSGPKEERVRFAAFMAVEVRGRSILVKAPVYV
ncbi:MAG: hypothetical protein M1830_004027 [Pleopsidium flavum]|nr:MAG: hypothetical protein M1830_004027 [Pleopsidium flavum]